MLRYLLFDDKCFVCDELANALKASTNQSLEILSLHDNRAKTLLRRVFPGGWDFVPYLVTVEEDKINAFTGFQAALRLGIMMGPKKAWLFWKLARRYGVSLPPGTDAPSKVDPTRRKLLKTGIGVGLGLVLSILRLPVLDRKIAHANHNCTLCYTDCWDAGGSTWGCACLCAGTCACPTNPDHYHQIVCYCGGPIRYCVWVGCSSDACGVCA